MRLAKIITVSSFIVLVAGFFSFLGYLVSNRPTQSGGEMIIEMSDRGHVYFVSWFDITILVVIASLVAITLFVASRVYSK